MFTYVLFKTTDKALLNRSVLTTLTDNICRHSLDLRLQALSVDSPKSLHSALQEVARGHKAGLGVIRNLMHNNLTIGICNRH